MLFLIIYWLKIIHSIHKLLWVAMTLLGKDHVLHAILNPTDFSENLLWRHLLSAARNVRHIPEHSCMYTITTAHLLSPSSLSVTPTLHLITPDALLKV